MPLLILTAADMDNVFYFSTLVWLLIILYIIYREELIRRTIRKTCVSLVWRNATQKITAAYIVFISKRAIVKTGLFTTWLASKYEQPAYSWCQEQTEKNLSYSKDRKGIFAMHSIHVGKLRLMMVNIIPVISAWVIFKYNSYIRPWQMLIKWLSGIWRILSCIPKIISCHVRHSGSGMADCWDLG